MYALIDCNNFYASCERVFNPKLVDRPVVILSNNDGCIIARSNEAKDIGIKMGAPAFKMEDLLKRYNVNVFSSNYTLYGDLSERVMKTLMDIVPDIEIYSIDEAFLDLRFTINDLRLLNEAERHKKLLELGMLIKQRVKQWTGIPVSVGIAETKTLAKVANHIAKSEERKAKRNNINPQSKLGVCILDSKEEIEAALISLPVEEIWGVGRQYTKLLKKYGIETALQLRNANDGWIRKHLTVMGLRMVTELRGIQCIEMEAEPPPKKAICTARSMGKMTSELQVLEEAVANHATRCAEKLRWQGSCANMLCVFLETNRFKEGEPQYNNYKVVKLPVASNSNTEIIKYAQIGLRQIFKANFRYKKAGVIVSGIVPETQIQQDIFDTVDRKKTGQLMETIDFLNNEYGRDVVRSAAQGFDRKWKLRQEKLSPCYTTRWDQLLTIKV
jgi:DNA polymerase V